MIYKPPCNIAKRDFSKKYVFLAGTIEMGKSEDWQSDITSFFTDRGWGVFNPRRDDWDSNWSQDFESPEFQQQVNWELNALDKSDYILIYFAPGTVSPISLYELGKYSLSNKISVVCPDGFFRKGNIEIGCFRDNIPFFDDMAGFKSYFIHNLQK